MTSPYVGRFAPSPTGPLHLGSLTVAVASFLHARQAHAGQWLVRIEDIDPPREVPGAADGILRTLEAFELSWDREVLYQSSRRAAYDTAAAALLNGGFAFRCSCTRSQLRGETDGEAARYPGTCRGKAQPEAGTAVRVRVDQGIVSFTDGLQGAFAIRLDRTTGDYIVVRRDGLPAYHLAVVLDDAFQGVTTIVRGVDLLDSTAAHVHLQRTLRAAMPRYFHLPVVTNAAGQKLSKQNGARAVGTDDVSATARTVLELLGMRVPADLIGARPGVLWRWALDGWRIESLRGQRELAEPG